MNNLSKSFIVGFVADHRQNSSNSALYISFLNHHTPVPVGPEKIGNRIGAKYVYVDIIKPKRGYYHFAIQPITLDDDSVDFPYTRKYYHMLEKSILRAPHLWLWSHRRWLYQ